VISGAWCWFESVMGKDSMHVGKLKWGKVYRGSTVDGARMPIRCIVKNGNNHGRATNDAAEMEVNDPTGGHDLR